MPVVFPTVEYQGVCEPTPAAVLNKTSSREIRPKRNENARRQMCARRESQRWLLWRQDWIVSISLDNGLMIFTQNNVVLRSWVNLKE